MQKCSTKNPFLISTANPNIHRRTRFEGTRLPSLVSMMDGDEVAAEVGVQMCQVKIKLTVNV